MRQAHIMMESTRAHNLLDVPASDLRLAEIEYVIVANAAKELGVTEDIVRRYAKDRGFLCDHVVSRPTVNLFGAVLFLMRHRYYNEAEAIEKIGDEQIFNRLVVVEKIRVQFYHGLYFYNRDDVDREEKLVKSKSAHSKSMADLQTSRNISSKMINGVEYISITKAACLMHTHLIDARKWILKYKKIPVILVQDKNINVHWMIKLSDLVSFMDQPYFTEERFGVKELAQILRVSELTINRWKRSGKIKVLSSPGGHHFVPFSQVAKCIELAQYPK